MKKVFLVRTLFTGIVLILNEANLDDALSVKFNIQNESTISSAAGITDEDNINLVEGRSKEDTANAFKVQVTHTAGNEPEHNPQNIIRQTTGNIGHSVTDILVRMTKGTNSFDDIAGKNNVKPKYSKRAAGWSADDFTDVKEWETNWDIPTPSSNTENYHYEVLDMTKKENAKDKALERSSMKKVLLGLPIAAAILVGNLLFFWCCCCRKNCFQSCGQAATQKYVPGVKVGEDGKTEFHEITEEEKAAAQGLGEFLM